MAAKFATEKGKTMDKQNEPEDTEKPEEIADEIISRLNHMHGSLVDASTHVGFTRDAFRTVRPLLVKLGDASTTDPDASAIYSSNIQFLKAFRDEIRGQENSVAPLPSLFKNTSGSVASFISATGTTAAFVDVSAFSVDNLPVFTSPDQYQAYARRFSQFDLALGETYQGIWEVLYGTRADPERAALYLIRQAFDHLFGKLAPDDKVRESLYWTKKTTNRLDQVTREERIQYAAATHIKDKARASTLLSSARHMLEIYEALNRAHQRNKLNQAKARLALTEMRTFLEDWANAIGI